MPAPSPADPQLVESWLRARSICRGLPQPVADRGGLRLDTGLPAERMRYVFAQPCAGLIELGEEIDAPLIFLKLCGTPAELAALLPARWSPMPPGFMMTGPDRRGTAALPPGYRIEMLASGATTSVRITGETGELAASGYATEAGGVFLYDRIVTEIDHRRRGLGSAVMSALAGVRQSAASVPVLVATEDGRALYTQLGWTLHTPFSTACIPPE